MSDPGMSGPGPEHPDPAGWDDELAAAAVLVGCLGLLATLALAALVAVALWMTGWL